MTIEMKKVWFVDGQIIEQEIPESEIYKQEPVAYLCENAVGHKYFRWKKPSSTYKPIALYTALPPCQTCEALARAVMLDQTSHDTTPQRDLESTTDMMMELADRLGELPDDIDPRAWSHLLVYAPKRKPLTEQEIGAILEDINAFGTRLFTFTRAIELHHGIGDKK